ncbi:MAG TPA: hypothetical protein VFS43_32855 [Polyangiaceae bacterium]|nr:hypothetical protein [Polyangiaceae bacterium]
MTSKALGPLLLTIAASTAGCATAGTQARAPGEGHLTLTGGGAAHQLKIEGRELYGSRVNVSFLPDGYRGTIDNKHIVDLRPEGEDKILGSVAGGPTELYIEEGPSFLRVRGLYRGRVSSFFLTPNRFQGLVGDCSYTLWTRETEPGYTGGRACGRGAHFARMTLPTAFHERPAQERVAMLTLLLGG